MGVITIVHGRASHLTRQREGLAHSAGPSPRHVIVAMDDPSVRPMSPQEVVVHVSGDSRGLPLAAARNRGASEALSLGADLLVFLDVDCIPSPELIGSYAGAALTHGADLLCGPVAYLPAPPAGGYDLDRLADEARFHPGRPTPPMGEIVRDDEHHELFWSLSFAVTPSTWRDIGGFDEAYAGYGGEDTDFAMRARRSGIALAWVGAARAFHQHHPVSRPPVEHVDDIVRNATIFHARWGSWPMQGWLDAFEDLGLIRWTGDGVLQAVPRTPVVHAAG